MLLCLNRRDGCNFLIAHAGKLKDEGRIVQGDAWQNVRERLLQTGNVTVQNRDGQGKSIGGSVAKSINQLCCPSYSAARPTTPVTTFPKCSNDKRRTNQNER